MSAEFEKETVRRDGGLPGKGTGTPVSPRQEGR